jgi:hypothetical protein
MLRKNFLKSSGYAFAGLYLGSGLKNPLFRYQAGLPALLTDRLGNPITSLSGWIENRKIIAGRWSDFLGLLDPNPNPLKLNILIEDRPDGLIRQFIEYQGEPGLTVNAYLLKPQNIINKLPGVVALHSTSDNQMKFIAGVEEGNIVALGYKLAQMGFVVICPMCFLWHDKGDKTYEQQVVLFQQRHPKSKGMAKMLFDAQRAVDVLTNLEEVDNSRIGAMGHSLGGKEAFYLGAFDERVKVIVSNEGGIGIDFSNWDDPWYLGKEIHSFNHQHHEVLGLCAPKPFLLIGGDSADGEKSIPYIEAVLPVYNLYGMPKNIELFNHDQGHNIAPIAEKRTYEWMVKHL